MEKEIFQEGGRSKISDFEGELEMEDTQRWKWTRKQAQYHRKRKEMLAYDSFEDFVSSMSSGQ